MIGTLTLDLNRQVFISWKDTDGFGDETLSIEQKMKPAVEFILTFYIPENSFRSISSTASPLILNSICGRKETETVARQSILSPVIPLSKIENCFSNSSICILLYFQFLHG
jgi:hypothetical protein